MHRSLAASTVVSVLLLLPGVMWAQQDFTRGPAVRVIPNTRVEIRWIHGFVGDGKVEVFDNPDGSGPVIIDKVSGSPANDHTLVINVGGALAPDTTYYFRVTHHDPINNLPDVTGVPPLPSFFTGAQAPGADPDSPKLTASDGAPYDRFGVSTAISGDTAVIGAPSADSIGDAIGFSEGAAYVFVKPAGGWASTPTFAAKLTPSDGAGFARFGTSVAIDGDTIVVGAPHSLAVYVFVKPENGWTGNLTETAKLTASAPVPMFGTSVAIGGDAVVVGASWADNFKGSAFVFMKPPGGWAGNLTETAKLTASDREPESSVYGDFFGHSVAISGDTVVVGAPTAGGSSRSGSAYVFVNPGNGWAGNVTETAKLTPSGGRVGEFGSSVAISGNTVVVGALFGDGSPDSFIQGSSFVFVKPETGWASNVTASAKLIASDGEYFDYFGFSAAITGDTVLIGAVGHEDSKGAAYVFRRPADGWAGNLIEAAKLTVSDGAPFDLLGSALAIGDGTIVVGAEEWVRSNSQGSVYVFSSPTAPTDSTVPAITPAVFGTLGNNGWYVGNVSITWSVQDDESDVTSMSGCESVSVTSDTTGTTFTCTATSAGGTASQSITVKVDKTPPVITINSPAAATYVPNQAVAADYFCADGGSGLASCIGPVASGQNVSTSVPGANSFTVNALDQAGNTVSATVNYQVQYPSAGTLCNGAPGRQILEPIRADGSSVFKQKSVVPAKFRVCDANGVSIGTPGLVSNFSIIRLIAGTVVADVNEAVTSTTPDSAFRWDPTDQQWIFNISTRNLKANATYVYRISLNDGTYIDFQFGLK